MLTGLILVLLNWEEGHDIMKLNPIRLREIRIARGYTAEALAKELNITKQSISKYEKGSANPSPDIIEKLILKLNIPRSYLTKESLKENSDIIPLFFRTAKTTRQNEKELARIKIKWAYEIISGLYELDNTVRGNINLPTFKQDMNIIDKAESLREFWNLGLGPINNLLKTLENNGIHILTINTSKIHVDAYSQVIEGIPLIILNQSKGSAVRWRFSLAHELGHLVLHQNVTAEELDNPERFNEIENEAHLFASNFLLPAGSFGKCIISDKLDYFLGLKKEWKVSIAAMVFRCGQLNLLSEQKILNLQKQISKRKWHAFEPLDNEIQYENPSRIPSFIKSHISDKNNAEGFLNNVRLAIEDIENLCSLGGRFFSELGAGYTTYADNRQYTQLSIF